MGNIIERELMTLKGTNGTITAYEDKVVISRSGFFAVASQGFKGDRTFFYQDLTGIDFKKPGFTNGYIKFLFPGAKDISSRSGLLSTSPETMSDENAVVLRAFNKDVPALSEDMYNLLMEKIHSSKNASSIQQTSFSSADEILKYKQLLDSGIITQEEFDAKKKQLLNI